MSSSELSNALNPASVVPRQRRRHAPTSALSSSVTTSTSTLPPLSQPHRSELDFAIAPPEPLDFAITPSHPAEQEQQAVVAPAIVPQPPRNGNPVVELFRVVASAREAALAEQQRRIAWEREQESKAAQRQLELERQILEMRQELNMLRAYVGTHPGTAIVPVAAALQPEAPGNTIPTTARIEPASPTSGPSPQTPLSPISPIPQHPEVQWPLFVEGSSSRPYVPEGQDTLNAHIATQSPFAAVLSPPASAASSPHFAPATAKASASVVPSFEAPPTPQSTGPAATPIPPTPRPESTARKRPRHVTEDESDYSESESEDDAGAPDPGRAYVRFTPVLKRLQHAMRIHIRKMMGIKHGDDLPESHFEGAPFIMDQPVRFVWGKTPRQSAHNAAMKKRIVADIKANRTAYKHVADKEFNKKMLDSVFDQVFTTLRQKFKAQSDTTTATRLQRRENNKALKARRLQRKKAKLGNRADARKKLGAFAQPAFEAALHQDCMSSEESDGEYVEDGEKVQVFRTRGPSWRSARLRRYFAVLDDHDRAEKSFKPKRGVGRRVRREGPPKDGLFLPPKGIVRWMVSRRWLQETEATRPDLVDTLRELIVDVVEQETEVTRVLLGSEESEDEAQQGLPGPDAYAHVSDTSYSLQNALQPV
ncbi:hypothetical protein C8Q77DRAFT_1153750 [Trametes polyzona]|nr:hypothetical protein C8Q77DRAFT_1153750 [Trametes polyzona]